MLTNALTEQFKCAFDILQAAIPSFTVDQWQRGSPPFNGPARAVAHTLYCAERYTGATASGSRYLAKPVHEMSDEETPSQEQMLRFLDEARKKTFDWIDSIGDEGLAVQDDGRKTNALGRVTYALRHFQHHTGEVCAYQKLNGLEPAPWK